MSLVITLVAPSGQSLAPDTIAVVREVASIRSEPRWLAPEIAVDLEAFGYTAEDAASLKRQLTQALAHVAVDWAVQPPHDRRKRLLLADMDSTIIGQECIDEIAAVAGVGEAVSAITKRAMAGELDFEGALRERVALLAGFEESALARVFDERITINAGARTLVATMRATGARTLLVSGGFTFFTSRVAAAVGFDEHRANVLKYSGGRLDGTVTEPILGRDAKREALMEACGALGAGTEIAIAVGDGANDLTLIGAAGLGVAYRAKPILAEAADARVDHADLTALLYFQGYSQDELVTAEST